MMFKFNLLFNPLQTINQITVRTIGEREINSETLQGYCSLSYNCRGHIRNQHGENSHGCPFSPKSEVTALEMYNSYGSHGENKLVFIYRHHPEMACMDCIWSQVSTYTPL